jgi:hypothetical protein
MSEFNIWSNDIGIAELASLALHHAKLLADGRTPKTTRYNLLITIQRIKHQVSQDISPTNGILIHFYCSPFIPPSEVKTRVYASNFTHHI